MEAALTSDITRFRNQLNNKLNFMAKAFIEPYFESGVDEIVRGLGHNTAETAEGILRYNYTSNSVLTAGISSADDMKRLFPDTPSAGEPNSPVLTLTDTTILSSLKDYGAIPTERYTIYEYVGTLFVPEASSYVFSIQTTGQAELFLDYVLQASVYGAGRTARSVAVPLEMGEVPIRIRFVQVGNPGETQQLEVSWRKSTDDADSAATLKCDNLYYDPALQNRNPAQSATFNEDALIDNLADYHVRYRSYFGVQSSAFRDAVKNNTYLAKIYVGTNPAPVAAGAAVNPPYQPFQCSPTPTVIPTGELVAATGKINGDVNFNGYLTALATVTNNNRIDILRQQMTATRQLYNALDDVIYEKIRNNPSDPTAIIDDYAIDTTTGRPGTVPANTVLTAEAMEILERVTPVERFVFRRLVLLMDLVYHAHFSMFLFEKVYGDTTVSCATAISDILSHFVTRLKYLNEKYDQMFESGSNVSQNDILSNLYENIHTFEKNAKTMDKLTTDFRSSKLTLKTNLKTMETEKALYSTGNNWTRIFLSVTVIVVLTLVAYVILSATNPAYKWVGAGTVSALAFLTVLLIYLVKSRTMERFTTGDTYNPIAWSQAIATQSSIDVIRVAYQYDMMREINAYIQNTIHMALILQNSKTYGYINHTMQKEINYYTASKQQVDNAKTLAKASGRMYNLESRNNLSRVNVYIALIVILTFAIVGYHLAGDRKYIQYTVLGIAAFLLLMVALLYIIDVERKVRTDGRKIYWGQPNDMLAKL
jgi:hypothetical protein